VERTLPEEGIDAIKRFLVKSTGSESNFFFLNSGGVMNRVPPHDTAFYWRKTKYYVEWTSSWTKDYETQKNIALVEKTRTELDPFVIGSIC
jgi:hypothetical protein